MERVLEKIKVYNCESPATGREVANQFIICIYGKNGTKQVFQSYNSVIAVKENGKVYLDRNKWDYSVTTGRYRNQFLGESIAETRKKIADGTYTLCDLN